MNKNALILVVDDDPVMLRATGRLLKSAGYEVIKAGTGSDALRLAKEQEPDLVLLDVVLLDMDGLEVCRRIKADPQLADIYVILGNCSGTLAKGSRRHVANAITAFARVSKVLCVCPCPPHDCSNRAVGRSAWCLCGKGEIPTERLRRCAQRRMMAADTVRAILFDLDDTLLGNDMDRFLKAYFGLLAPHVAAYVPPEKFIPALLAATRAMVEKTDPGVTNQQAFAADFFPRVGRTMDEMMPVFDDFYATQFGKLRSHTRCLPEARAVVRAAFGAGYDVVIATNPLFPDTAIRQRLEWADVAEFPFKLVTSYETMHFSKPHPEYYLEIAERIGRQPSECVMVGDDWDNDIAPAMRAGLRVYWVNTGADLLPESDSCARGTLADFGRWLTEGMLNAL